MEAETGAKGGKKAKEAKPKELTFKCRFCQGTKPISEMVVVTRLFPPVVACRDCEKEMR